MKYNSKYDRYVDDDLVIYRYNKDKDKLVQCSVFFSGKYLAVYTKLGNKKVHRVIWETMVGEVPEGYELDHINTIRTDNRLENLRCVTTKENNNNPLTRQHRSEVRIGKKLNEETKKRISKSRTVNSKSDFGKKYIEHFGYSRYENPKQYHKEQEWYRHHNKCRWEVDNEPN